MSLRLAVSTTAGMLHYERDAPATGPVLPSLNALKIEGTMSGATMTLPTTPVATPMATASRLTWGTARPQ